MRNHIIKVGKICLAVCLVLLLSSYSYNSQNKAIEECLQSAYLFRDTWCDALRGEISLSQWKTEGEKYLASTMTTVSNQPGLERTYDSRGEYLDEQNGYVADSRAIFGDFEVCINNFGANSIGSRDKQSRQTSVKVPTTRIFTLPSIELIEYDVDLYECRREGGRWKVNFWNEVQGLNTFL